MPCLALGALAIYNIYIAASAPVDFPSHHLHCLLQCTQSSILPALQQSIRISLCLSEISVEVCNVSLPTDNESINEMLDRRVCIHPQDSLLTAQDLTVYSLSKNITDVANYQANRLRLPCRPAMIQRHGRSGPNQWLRHATILETSRWHHLGGWE